MKVDDKKPIGFCPPYQNLDRSLIDPNLGSDCIMPEEVMKACPDIVYTEQQLRDYAGFFPDTAMLYVLQINGYCLVPQPPSPSSLLGIYDLKPKHFKVQNRVWYEERSYAQEDKTGCGWLAIKKQPIEESIGKELSKQKKILLSAEEVPNVAQIAWAITIFRDIRQEYIFKGVGVRSSSVDRAGAYVIVNNFFPEEGIAVMEGWDLVAGSRWGISSVWKL